MLKITVLCALVIALVSNTVLIINLIQIKKQNASLKQDALRYAKKAKRLSTVAQSRFQPSKIKVKPIKEYTYDNSETAGEIMSTAEAQAIYESDEKYRKVGLDGIIAPNPFGNPSINRGRVTDKLAQKYMLRMIDHPKERTRRQVDWLASAVQINKTGLIYQNIYRNILNRWRNIYDFSHLKEDRQKIIDLQDKGE
ncbi:MAG: hypothetical protein LKI80_14520 [Sporolactobacillus sp.]|jgi:hypothetical protein|nr:hypothetical protein [Sporolactobacillus sp.]